MLQNINTNTKIKKIFLFIIAFLAIFLLLIDEKLRCIFTTFYITHHPSALYLHKKIITGLY